jgi:hypothetical protein
MNQMKKLLSKFWIKLKAIGRGWMILFWYKRENILPGATKAKFLYMNEEYQKENDPLMKDYRAEIERVLNQEGEVLTDEEFALEAKKLLRELLGWFEAMDLVIRPPLIVDINHQPKDLLDRLRKSMKSIPMKYYRSKERSL